MVEQATKKEFAQPTQIGWLGPKGTFTEKAAKRWRTKVGESSADLAREHSPNIKAIFKGVLDESLDVGVVPIENTIGGPVKDTHRELEELVNIAIIGEVVLPIQQYFYSQDDQQVATIASKDQALAQAANWIASHYPQVNKMEVSSTSLAVQMAAENPTIGAIASEDAAVELGLSDRLRRTDESVEDNKANTTTFVAIAKNADSSEPSGNDKTTLILDLPNYAGSLYSVLTDFASRRINLTKIKSLRSADGKTRFLISIDGHRNEDKTSSALTSLDEKGTGVKILGSYPKDSYFPKHRVEPDMKNAIKMIEKEAKNDATDDKDNHTVVFSLRNQVGALAKVLGIFAERNINLTEIDSMPSGNFEEYIFYLSFNKSRHLQDLDDLIREQVILYSELK